MFIDRLRSFRDGYDEVVLHLSDDTRYQGQILVVGDDYIIISSMGIVELGSAVQISHIISVQRAGR